MKIYLIKQYINVSYDSYVSAVVAASSEKEAKNIHPGSIKNSNEIIWVNEVNSRHVSDQWVDSPGDVDTVYLGEATKGIVRGVICASFYAG